LPSDEFIYNSETQQENYVIVVEGYEWFLYKNAEAKYLTPVEITQEEFIKGKLSCKILKTKVQNYYAILNFENNAISVGCKEMTIENARILRDKINLKVDDFVGWDWFENCCLGIEVNYEIKEIVICDIDGPIGYSFYFIELEALMTEVDKEINLPMTLSVESE